MRRRQFLQGALVLAGVGGLALWYDEDTVLPQSYKETEWLWLTPEQALMLSVFMLALLPNRRSLNQDVLWQQLKAVDALLPQLAQQEQQGFQQLLTLLDSTLGRLLLAPGYRTTGTNNEQQTLELMARWRDSSIGLLNNAYSGIKELLYGVYYSGPETWADIGYPGPPQLHRPAD